MHRFKFTVALTAMMLLASGASLLAQGRGGGSKTPKAPTTTSKATGSPKVTTAKVTGGPKVSQTTKVTGASKAPKPATHASGGQKTTTPKVAKGPSAKTGGAKADTKLTKTTTPGAPKKTDVAKANGKSSKKSATTTAAAETGTTTGTTTGGTNSGGTTGDTTSTTPLTPVQQKLQKNTNLASKLQSRLPAGTDLMKAAADFRNLGQFVAAVNVSNNLGIDFVKLKAKMVDDGYSLGQSIQALKPTASGTVEAQRAEYDARTMIAETEGTQVTASATVTTTNKTKKKNGKTSGGGSDD